jgi:adenosylhomocysteine nucleosidase
VITGIVIALPEELGTLTSKKIEKGHCVFIADKLLATYSGAGPENAQAAAELLTSKCISHLISWGCAAALVEALKPGDLTLEDTLIDAVNAYIDIDSDWHRYSKNLLSKFLTVHTGRLAESKSIVSTSSDKQQLQSATGAIALDMESVAVAKVAKQHALPFLAIRAIADPVSMDLPQAINHSLDDQGDIVLSKLLLFIALHPDELPGLIKLGLHFNAAKNTLKLVAKHLDSMTCFDHSNTITVKPV